MEDGAEPDGLVAPVVTGLGHSLDVSAEFVAAWRSTAGDRREPPEPVNKQKAFDTAMAGLSGRRGVAAWRKRPAGLPAEEAYALVEGWFSAAQWALAATTLLQIGRIQGRFNLVDGYGQWIWNEGKPADIPLLDGRRVVVLDPPPYLRTWNIGRSFPMMRPDMRLERVLPAGEAAGHPAHVHIQRPTGDED